MDTPKVRWPWLASADTIRRILVSSKDGLAATKAVYHAWIASVATWIMFPSTEARSEVQGLMGPSWSHRLPKTVERLSRPPAVSEGQNPPQLECSSAQTQIGDIWVVGAIVKWRQPESAWTRRGARDSRIGDAGQLQRERTYRGLPLRIRWRDSDIEPGPLGVRSVSGGTAKAEENMQIDSHSYIPWPSRRLGRKCREKHSLQTFRVAKAY
ncbi:hypothetical protein B0H17DRAFT_352028 [Mycena rosella]|uniref:Uncharacterized protein n=1 Tax=Mycena rosella TaxID=1033263 RepID=A0AAD7CQE7_MYCRO|nr:hypothetical protein B0H17DRAFT_352028 [Mycena rosella]